MEEATAVTAASVGDLATLIPSWTRSRRAGNKSAKTISTYLEAANHLLVFLHETGMPTLKAYPPRMVVLGGIQRLLLTQQRHEHKSHRRYGECELQRHPRTRLHESRVAPNRRFKRHERDRGDRRRQGDKTDPGADRDAI
jgi:hypothetical protein